MRKLIYLFTFLYLCAGTTFAQTKVASGTVTSAEDGEPVAGASVSVKGTTLGTITGSDGTFALPNLPESAATLVVSYIGLETVEIEAGENLRIVMKESALSLDEVIVVAYGTAKKSSFSGAATQIKGETLQKTQVSNVSKALEGAVAGVQTVSSSGTPGSSSSIIIRGINSISASQNPLIIVDGVPYEGSLNSISTQDIESLTVLKDAAANSMYGARGSNGVVIITTKSGKSGKVKINFEGRSGFNGRAVPNYNIITDAGEFYEMMYESVRNRYLSEMSYMEANRYAASNFIGQYVKYNKYKDVADNDIIDPFTGKLTSSARAASYKWTDDWQKDPFENGLRQEYNINVSGGSEATTAYVSLGYLGDKGYVVNSGFNRVSARAKVDQNIGKYIKMGANILYSNTVQKTFGNTDSNYSNIFMFSQFIAPIYPIYLYDKDGKPVYDENSGKHRYDFGTENLRPYASEQNPLSTANEDLNRAMVDNFSGRGYFEVKFLKDFKFTANMAYDVFNAVSMAYATPNGGDAANVGGRGEKEFGRVAAMNVNQLLNWAPSFGRHNLDILLGHESKDSKVEDLYGHMTNFVDPYNPEFANAARYQDLTSYTQSVSLEGYFSRAEYNYDEKYYATASLRRDGSSRFHPDKRWGMFYSAGLSWRLEKEDFMRDVEAIDALKLKASYGTQGNDDIGVIVAYRDLYRIDRVDGEPALTKTLRGNPDLTWEKGEDFNVGVELRAWDKLNFNADFFIRKKDDLLFASPFPLSEGNPSTIWKNEMSMKNTGIEFDVTLDLIKTNDIKWSVSLNAMHYKNELTKLPASKPASEFPDGYQAGSYWRKLGGTLYDWYTYEYAGVDAETGLPLYNKYDKDGVFEKHVNTTSEATLRETGKSPFPDCTGGVSTALDAYGFDLSVQTSWQIGGYIQDAFYQALMTPGDNGTNYHKDMFNRWTPTNRNADIPGLLFEDQEANGTSDRWLTDASYFNLRNVTIGYSLPSSLIRKINVERFRIYLVGDNVLLFTKRKGLDPRQSFTGATGYMYSPISTYSLGINLSF
ncbi:MAG: SusC/RagA family TonB-linked outer membrane protein [Tannerella sp.]|nr:SusC/RagA family TonB-linked outer membrane protein [Tannerella sp.]